MDNKKSTELNVFDVIGQVTPKTKEDEGFEKSGALDDEVCPYNVCNGSGFIKDPNDSTKMIFCRCAIERRKKMKLINAHIKPMYFDKDFSSYDNETKSHLFKPLKVPAPFKSSTKMKEEINEPVDSFIKRNYTVIPQEREISDILTSFCEKNLSLINNGEKPANLLLFGDSGNGKTTYASLIGKYFLEQDKKVYFSTTQSFLDKIFDKAIDPKEIARKYDVLILDELFGEYHTDSQYAKKQLIEFFKIRDELGKMTICTSNGNPRDFSLLYGKSIMSLLNGTFFLFMLERETDGRVENMHQMYNDFNF